MWIFIEISFWLMAVSGVILAVTHFKDTMWTTLFTSLLIYLLSPCLIELIYHLISWFQLKFKLKQSQHEEFLYNINAGNFIPIIYSEGYNFKGVGMKKYFEGNHSVSRQTFELLIDKGVINAFERDWKVYQPSCCERVYLERMDFMYLLKLHYSVYLIKLFKLKFIFLPSWFLRQTYLKP